MKKLLGFFLIWVACGCGESINTDVQPIDNTLALKVTGRYNISELSSMAHGALIPQPDYTSSVTISAIANDKVNMTVFVSQNGFRVMTFYLGGIELSEGNSDTVDLTQGSRMAGQISKNKITVTALDQSNNVVRFVGAK
ncbi:MAG: hypothetical protein U0Y10_17510 [Spirosomataceae bacterium]